MPDVGRFLQELGTEAGKGLPPREAQALVDEARDHLEASIQARLELGMAPEAAEREAIAAFGAARALGRETRRREPWIDRRLLLNSLAIMAFWALCTGSQPGWIGVPAMAAFLGLHALFLVNGARTRRFQAATLALVMLPLWLLWSAKGATQWVWVDENGGYNRIARANAPEQARFRRMAGERAVRGARLLEEGYVRFEGGETDVSPSRVVSFDDAGRPRLFLRADRDLARAYWQAAMGRDSVASAERGRETLYAQADRIEAAWRGPWWLGLRHEAAYAFAASGWAVGSAYLGLYAGGWAFGLALRRWPRRRGAHG